MPPIHHMPGLAYIFTAKDSCFTQAVEACDETPLDAILIPEGQKRVYTRHRGKAIVPASKPTIFLFNREEHTLGNLLTAQLRKNPSVDYAGYKMPHPHYHHFELRIHMAPRRKEGYEAKNAVIDACTELVADLGVLGRRITAEWCIHQIVAQRGADGKTPYPTAPGRHFAAGGFSKPSSERGFVGSLATPEDVAKAEDCAAPPTLCSMIPGVSLDCRGTERNDLGPGA